MKTREFINNATEMTMNEAVEHYEKMVHRFAKSMPINTVCSYDDYVQEGRMAIVQAYTSYSPEKGASFTTWVYHMIKDAMLEYQKHHLTFVTGGTYLYQCIRNVENRHDISKDVGYFSRVDGYDVETLIQRLVEEESVSLPTAKLVYEFRDQAFAIDCDVSGAIDYDSDVSANKTNGLMDLLAKYLTDEEMSIIENYYGFKDQRLTMTNMGAVMGKSRKSMSYAINKTLMKIRHIPGIEEYAHCV